MKPDPLPFRGETETNSESASCIISCTWEKLPIEPWTLSKVALHSVKDKFPKSDKVLILSLISGLSTIHSAVKREEL